MNSSFSDLGISPPILKAIEEMGFETPTEIQERAIPHILNKEDLIALSKTGSGKTAVFGVSMLQLTDPAEPGPQGLILTPTRELAVQVDSDLKKIGKHLQHKTTAVYGQHNMNIEIQALSKGATIVTGTPGRVFDHIEHGTLKTKNIRFLVLDEADRMLDMGFLDQVVRIIRTVPRDRITLLFSATIPAEVQRICSNYMKDPVYVEIESATKTVDTIEQIYYRVAHNEKNTQLHRLLIMERPESCMIFCNTRMGVDRVQSFLTRKGLASQALHGDIPQGKRLKTIQQFKQGEFHILVATDVAARGIHIEDLSLVINYDVPVEKDSYVHRIGRTGRAGKEGHAITLVTSDDIMSLYEIEEHIGVMIPEGELPAEETYNARKAEAEQWIAANAAKAAPPREASEQGHKGGQRKSRQSKDSGDRPRQPQERQKSRQPEAGAGSPETRDRRGSGTSKNVQEGQGGRDNKGNRGHRENKDIRDNRDIGDNKDRRYGRDNRDSRDLRVQGNARPSGNVGNAGNTGEGRNHPARRQAGPAHPAEKPAVARPSTGATRPAGSATPRTSANGAADKVPEAKAGKNIFQRIWGKIFNK